LKNKNNQPKEKDSIQKNLLLFNKLIQSSSAAKRKKLRNKINSLAKRRAKEKKFM
jgi:hypothetical protein